jgi:hypothetical protein
MLSKCVNPACASSFRYLHEGKVFRLERDSNTDSTSHSFEYFWLCAACAHFFTVVFEQDAVRVRPLHLELPSTSVQLTSVETGRA